MLIPEEPMLLVHRATLIQCITEYLGIIKPPLYHVLWKYYPTLKINESELIKWIIAEELELIYGLFDRTHQHNHIPYGLIHNKLSLSMNVSLSVITAWYIKAPQVYEDNNTIDLKLTELDLFISYYSDLNRFKNKGIRNAN